MLLEGKEIKIIEKKNAGNDRTDEGLDHISRNLFKNLHLVFAMDLTNPEVNSIPHRFPYLMSKFVTNHIQPYTAQEYEEIASLFIEKWMADLENSNKEGMAEVLANIYYHTKEAILQETGVDVLKTSSFCNFLKELNSLARKHMQVRRNLQENFDKIFENHRQVEEIIGKLYENSGEIKTRLSGNQKIQDDLMMKQMQIKRDHEDVQKKMTDEEKKAMDEKVNITLIEQSLQSELEILWDPVEKAKHYLKELSSDDVDEMFTCLTNGSLKSVFLDAARQLYIPEDHEFTEKSFGFMINNMLGVQPDTLPDHKVFPFIDFLAKNKPRADIIAKVEDIYVAESVKLWCVAMEAFGKAKKSGNQRRQKGEQLKKRYLTRLDTIQEIKIQVDRLDTALEDIDDQIAKIGSDMDSDTKKIEDIEAKIEKAEKIRRLLTCDQESFKEIHSRFDLDNERIIGNSVLSAGFLVFYPPFSSTKRKEVRAKWEQLLTEAQVQFDLNLNHIDFVEGENTLSKLAGLQFPQTQTMYENFLILSRRNDLVVCIDPEDQAIPVISLSNLESTTIVTHMNDSYLKKNLIQSMARGESITIRNADTEYEVLLSPFLRKFIKKENETTYMRVFGSLCQFNPSFSMCILISSFKFLRLTSKLTIINFAFERSDLETFFLHVTAAKKLGNSYNQRGEVLASINTIYDNLEAEKSKIMDSLSLQVQQLLSESTLFDDVNATREKIDSMEEVKQNNLSTMEAIDGNIDSFVTIASFCSSLYEALLQLTALNPLYSLSLEAFLKLLDFKEEEEGEEHGSDGETAAAMSRCFGTFRLTVDEHTVVASLARKVDLNILRTDLPILALVLAVTVAEAKGLVDGEERKRLGQTVSRLLDVGQEDEVARLQPMLSEAEAKVVVAVLRSGQGGEVSEAVAGLEELSLAQRVAVLAAESPSTLR